LIQQTLVVQTLRRATKPTRSSQRKRVDAKTGRGAIKALRGKVRD
jgi:ribosome-associated protein